MVKTELEILQNRLAAEVAAYSVREVARALNLHPESVRDFLRHQRIHGFRLGNRWRVSHAVLTNLLKTGVPAKTE